MEVHEAEAEVDAEAEAEVEAEAEAEAMVCAQLPVETLMCLPFAPLLFFITAANQMCVCAHHTVEKKKQQVVGESIS